MRSADHARLSLRKTCKQLQVFFIYDKTSCPAEQVYDLLLKHTNLFSFNRKNQQILFKIRQRLKKNLPRARFLKIGREKFFCPKILKSDKIFRREKKMLVFVFFLKSVDYWSGEVLVIGIHKKRNASHKKQNHIVFVSMFRKF